MARANRNGTVTCQKVAGMFLNTLGLYELMIKAGDPDLPVLLACQEIGCGIYQGLGLAEYLDFSHSIVSEEHARQAIAALGKREVAYGLAVVGKTRPLREVMPADFLGLVHEHMRIIGEENGKYKSGIIFRGCEPNSYKLRPSGIEHLFVLQGPSQTADALRAHANEVIKAVPTNAEVIAKTAGIPGYLAIRYESTILG